MQIAVFFFKELLSGHVPYSHIKFDARVLLAIINAELPSCPATFDSWPHSWKSVWTICQRCWERDPDRRPTIGPLVQALEGVLAMQIVTDMSGGHPSVSSIY